MRVLQLIDNLHPGGAERMAVNIANELTVRNVESYLCCTREEGSLKLQLKPQVKYFYANRSGKIGINGIQRLNKFVQEEEITHLHPHGSSFFVATIIKLRQPYLKIVWHDHYGKRASANNNRFSILKLCSRKFDLVVTVNNGLASWARSNLLCAQVKMLTNFVVASAPISEYKEESNNLKIVALTNLRPDKNHELLITAFTDLCKTHENVELEIIGKDFQDEYAQRIKDLIALNSMENKIKLLGSRTDVDQLLSMADIGILTSQNEGLPMALLEYGVNSLPVICTNVGACAAVVGNHGIVVESGDQLGITQGMKLLIENVQLRQQYGVDFRKRIIENHGSKNYMSKLIELYTQLV
jgi:glycosyltransferase involved in cell wall biosynthesis